MKTTIIGLSGPSSSGKTTLARLLRSIFSDLDTLNFRSFIIHEDDFYHPDDRIPYTTLPSGTIIQDWDCADAIDITFLTQALAYTRDHGSLPPRLKSKEDLNESTDSGVSKETLLSLRDRVRSRLSSSSEGGAAEEAGAGGGRGTGRGNCNPNNGGRTVAILEGFLLYSPPRDENPSHVLRPIHELIDVHIFLPAPYDLVKERREKRSGYVTIGPAPVPDVMPERREDGEGDGEVDLHEEDSRPPQNFWTDPPGYVDDIVWPRYVQDHAWLLLPETGDQPLSTDGNPQELIRRVGQGVNMRANAGVTVAPGQGSMLMADLLQWTVDEILKHLEYSE